MDSRLYLVDREYLICMLYGQSVSGGNVLSYRNVGRNLLCLSRGLCENPILVIVKACSGYNKNAQNIRGILLLEKIAAVIRSGRIYEWATYFN